MGPVLFTIVHTNRRFVWPRIEPRKRMNTYMTIMFILFIAINLRVIKICITAISPNACTGMVHDEVFDIVSYCNIILGLFRDINFLGRLSK